MHLLLVRVVRFMCIICILAFVPAHCGKAAVFTYTANGVYDDASNANAVDFNASGNALTSLLGTDVAGFSASVATAFASGNGGVVQFEGQVGTNQITTAQANNGVGPAPDTLFFSFNGGAKSLAITSNAVLKGSQYGSATALSGVGQLDIGNPATPTNTGAVIEGPTAFAINFGAITGGVAGEAVTSVGFTALSRNGNASTDAMSVTYSDNTTSSTLSRALLGTASTDDTFYGFVAPAGLSISSLNISRTARQPFDDLGFITSVVAVPEPTTFALLAIGGVMLSGRRIRRSFGKSRN